jgi:hypothetical protein
MTNPYFYNNPIISDQTYNLITFDNLNGSYDILTINIYSNTNNLLLSYTFNYVIFNYTINFLPFSVNYHISFILNDSYQFDLYTNYVYSYPSISYTNNINNLLGSLTYDISEYIINPYGLYSQNYLISYFSGNLFIYKKELYVIANDITKDYDEIPILNNITVRYSEDISNNEITGSILNIGTSYNSIAVGTYNIIPSNLQSLNYTLIYVPGILTITQTNNINVSFNILYISKYYDRSNLLNNNLQVNINYTIIDISTNELINNTINNTILTYTGTILNYNNNIGYYLFDIFNIFLHSSKYNYIVYDISKSNIQILPKYVQINFIGIDKIYDNTFNASITVISISGIIYPDIVNIISYKYNFIDKNFGINKPIIIYDILLNNSNYISSNIYTFASILYPINLNIISYNTTTNNITITINPVLSIIPIEFNNTIIDIYQNYIISNNTIYNLNNNILLPLITLSNVIFTSINLNIISTLTSVIYTNNNYTTFNETYIGNYNFTFVTQIYNNISFIIGLSGIIFKTNNSALNWYQINSGVINNLNDAALINNNIIFIIGNNGLLLVSYNSGQTFNKKNISSYNLNSIFMVNQYYGFIVGDNGVIYSTLNGITWNLIYQANYNLNNVFVYNINNIYIVGDNGTLLISNNRGITWNIFETGTIYNLLKIYVFNSISLYIIGESNLLLYYKINPGGIIEIYNNSELLLYSTFPFSISVLTLNLNQLDIGNYSLIAKFIPNQNNLYSIGYSNIFNIVIKPKFYYDISSYIINYGTSINSNYPIVDQSGGIFYTTFNNSNIILNNLTGQLLFLSNININTYNIPIIYILNDISNITIFNLTVRPVLFYDNTIINLLYGISGKSNLPYINPQNGIFTITKYLTNNKNNNYSINIDTSGIIYFNNKINISYNIYKISYTFNNISNIILYQLNVIPIINYLPNITNVNYLTSIYSVIPYVYNKGGIFLLNNYLSLQNNIFISNSGIIYFNNSINVGSYIFNVIYKYNDISNFTIYYLNVYPILHYYSSYLVFNYNTLATIQSPFITPINGIFNILDISGNLVYNNYISVDLSGTLLLNNTNINIGLYKIIIIYTLNGLSTSFILNITINTIIYYNNIIGIYNQYINTIIPNITLINTVNTFNIIALDNLLVQYSIIKINNYGFIDICNNNIVPNIYHFKIIYLINNVYMFTTFVLTIIPYLLYIQDTLLLSNNNSGNSLIPITNSLNNFNGIFSISGNISFVQINNNGQLYFNSNIESGTYIITVLYTVNNVFNYFNYNLIVYGILPFIYYSIPNSTIIYNTYANSIKPYINLNGGLFTISNNILNDKIIIDSSGIIYFYPLINPGTYILNIYYILNNTFFTTFYTLVIKPIFFYVNNITNLQYNNYIYYNTEIPIVDPSNGNFNCNININQYGCLTISGFYDVGTYIIPVTYILNMQSSIFNYIFNVTPNLYYTISSIVTNYGVINHSPQPIYSPNYGIFSINLFSVNNLGIITFNNLIIPGIYNLVVNYTVNSIFTLFNFVYTVNPTIIYYNSYTILQYDQSGYSNFPTYTKITGYTGIFKIVTCNLIIDTELISINTDNIIINNLGIINFNNSINVGKYIYTINYELNNTNNNTTYYLDIIPNLKYDINNITIYYNEFNVSYSENPIFSPIGGTFKIEITISNIIIDISSGIIGFIGLIDVGNYNFVITYTYNNQNVITNYYLQVKPYIIYNPNNCSIIYKTTNTSLSPIYKPSNVIFTLTDICGNLNNIKFVNINNNGIINFLSGLNVGIYQFLINVTIKNITSSTLYYLYVIPIFNYFINSKNINYGTSNNSIIPNHSPINGQFYIYDISYVYIDNSGIIFFNNNIGVGSYSFNVEYKLNEASNYALYYLYVYPNISYNPNNINIIYNNIFFSNSPIISPNNLIYNIYDLSNSNLVLQNKIGIDTNSGIIYFTNNCPIGSYKVNISVTLNNLTTYTIYYFNIIPKLIYDNYITLYYQESYINNNVIYDPSGGIFNFTDISGSLLDDNIIGYNILDGTFNLIQYPNSGIYKILITYTINEQSNFQYIYFNILSKYNYTTYKINYNYNTDNYLNIPFKFADISLSGNNLNGINIDTSNNIIYFSNITNVDSYIVNIYKYITNYIIIAIYYINILPIIYYPTNKLSETYIFNSDLYYYSIIPYCYPYNGLYSIDISNYNIFIDTSGIISFNKSLYPNIYNIIITYNYNNILNYTNFVFTMNPYLNYIPNSIQIKYNDISYTQQPIVYPENGLFKASVSFINLIYTGISINEQTGILKFNNNVNSGNWSVDVTYYIYNVKTTVTYTAYISSDYYYLPPCISIPYNSNYSTSKPYVLDSGGTFSSNSVLAGFSINSINGILNFNNINIGIYNIPVSYFIYNFGTITINYTLVITPLLSYNNTSISGLYMTSISSSIPNINPLNGYFSLTNNNSNEISINDYGIIYCSNLLNVNIYNLFVNYTFNTITTTENFTVTIYPVFYYSIGILSNIFGNNTFSEIPNTFPKNGKFIINDINFIVDISGVIKFSNINVGVYNINVLYIYNSISINTGYLLNVYPQYFYFINHLNIVIYTLTFSQHPIYNEPHGIFNFISISGLIPYYVTYVDNNYIDNGVTLNGYTGLLIFGNKIPIGNYYFMLKYTLNNLSSMTKYSISIIPYIKYSNTTIILEYNTNIYGSRPIVDPSGGNFILSNINSNKITINSKTGVIYYNYAINVGIYKIIVNYTVNNISNTVILNLIINPFFLYTNSHSIINMFDISNSNMPTVIQQGGNFFINNKNDVYNITNINPITGIITFINFIQGYYIFSVNYVLNNTSTTTNYYLTVLPKIEYIINYTTINYESNSYSDYPEYPLINITPEIIYDNYKINTTLLGVSYYKVIIDYYGKIYFDKYINTGNYELLVSYTSQNINNIIPYYLTVLPNFYYSISSIILNYKEILYSCQPYTSPIKGHFYFTDNSNNIININNITGIIYNNFLPVNTYIFNVSYYLKQFVVTTNYQVTVLPIFYYTISFLIFEYYDDYIYSVIPITDPSNGIFSINTNLQLVSIDYNGQLKINKLFDIGNYILNVSYTYNNITSYFNYFLYVKPLFKYVEQINIIHINNFGISSIPITFPEYGIFSINNSISGLIIDENTGIIYISNFLKSGEYLLNLMYTVHNIFSEFNYYIQIVPDLYYNPNLTIKPYGFSGYSSVIYNNIVLTGGIYTLDNNNYLINKINIDLSSGQLYFNQYINVNNYNIYVNYNYYDININLLYKLTVIPYIYYDISYISILYGESYKSNIPILAPNLNIDNILITNYGLLGISGELIIENFDINSYDIIINYTVNNITNYYKHLLIVYPQIIFSNNLINIYGFENYYIIKTYPINGLLFLDISNIIINNDGTIIFDLTENVNKYSITINYEYNKIIQSVILNYTIIPYINYMSPFYKHNKIKSDIPDVAPNNGEFQIIEDQFFVVDYIDTAGIIYFNNNINIGSYYFTILYTVNNISNSFNYNLIIDPYIYYSNIIDNYYVIDYGSKLVTNAPYVNFNDCIFSLIFDYNTLISIDLISINSLTGVITVKPFLDVNNYFFYVKCTNDNITFILTFYLTVNPIIIYPHFNINQNELIIGGPLYISYSLNNIFDISSNYSFINIDENGILMCSDINIVGKIFINVIYEVNNVSVITTVYININPIIYFNDYIINYLEYWISDKPYISISGGIFISNNLNIYPNIYTGIFDASNILVDNYFIDLIYLINDVSGHIIFNLLVKPNIYYNSIINTYGNYLVSEIPIYSPINGIFSLNTDNIDIKSLTGNLILNTTISVNTFNILVYYTYNNIQTSYSVNIQIIPKLITCQFIPEDKIYDASTNVIFISNKLNGVINNDIVYINSFNAYYITYNIGYNQINIENIIIDGINSSNYDICSNYITFGNIVLSKYYYNYIRINKGRSGYSTLPINSVYFDNSLFLITNITISGIYDATLNDNFTYSIVNNYSNIIINDDYYNIIPDITLNPYGIINWTGNLNIGKYYIIVTSYDIGRIFLQNNIFVLEVTTNIYENIIDIYENTNNSLVYNFYNLNYSSINSYAYVIDDNIIGLIAKFYLSYYNQNNNIIHYNENENILINLKLENINSNNLILYQLNDDNTINTNLGYALTYLGNNIYQTYINYIFDFIIKDLNADINLIFNFNSGVYYTTSYILLTIKSSILDSAIYYTLDNNITTNLYSIPIKLSSGYIYNISAYQIISNKIKSPIFYKLYDIRYVPCILSGNFIKTPDGEILIDDLKENDLIITDDNRIVPIIKIIKYNVENPCNEAYPICIPENFFNLSVPNKNTFISQNHAIKLNEKYWIYGHHHIHYFNIYKISPTYFHILLPNYFTDNLIVNNLIVESWSGYLIENANVKYKNKSLIKYKNKEYISFKKIKN